jgi:O-antigen/teichoic acid export membrane protein
MAGTSVLVLLFAPLNKLIIARYEGAKAVPLYDIAFQVSMQLRAFADSALRPLTAEAGRTRGAQQGEQTRVRRLGVRATWAVALVGLLLFGLVGIASRTLLSAWLKSTLRPELVPVLRVMLIAAWVSSLGIPSYYILLGRRKTLQLFVSHGIAGAVNLATVGLLVAFTAGAGAYSVTWATAAGMLATSCYLIILAGSTKADPPNASAIQTRKPLVDCSAIGSTRATAVE